jgi:hypothetical protein
VSAQTDDAILKGKVTDTKGEGLPFAALLLMQNDVPKAQGQTDMDGNYRIGPVGPGTYTLKVQLVGYETMTIKGMQLQGGITNQYNVKMAEEGGGTGKEVTGVTITATPPILKPDNTTDGNSFGTQEIKHLGNRSIEGIVSSSVGVIQTGDGLHSFGSRSTSNVYYVDGIKTRTAPNLPKGAIEEIETITGGLPAQYGDATGVVTTITTRGPSMKTSGSLEGVSSQFIDPYGYNLIEGTLSGPLIIKGKKTSSPRSILGYFLSANGTFQKVSVPSPVQVYQLNPGVLQSIEENPIRQSPLGSGFVSNSDFVTFDQMHPTYVSPNIPRTDYSFSAKLDFAPVEGVDITAGATAEGNNYRFYNFADLLFNYDNNELVKNSTERGFIRFRQYFKSSEKSAVKNASYTIQLNYSQSNQTVQDARLKDNFWDYGYIGKFEVNEQANYNYLPVTINGRTFNTNRLVGYYQNGVSFTPGTENPVLARYTQQYFQYAGEVQSYNQIITGGGLLNGYSPPSVYSLWNNVGVNAGSYQKSEGTQFTLYASGQASIKNHNLKFGIEYEQRSSRGYTLGVGNYGTSIGNLWILARQLTNSHLTQFDTLNPIPVYDQYGNFQDTVNYKFQIAPGTQSNFDKNLRSTLQAMGETDGNGRKITDQTLINIDRYDPSIYKLSMFSADELLNKGNSYVSYYGYDYLGNSVKGKHSVDEFLDLTKRTIGAYNPVYFAGYVEDKFELKDLIFRLGLRADYFNANEYVLKDPYSLYPVRTVAEVKQLNGTDIIHPGNIGQDYAVYVDNALNPTKVVGYRSGNVWYDATGAQVSDPGVIARATASGTIQPYLVANSKDDAKLSSSSFENYKPSVNLNPRVAFSFPISEQANFFANYDIVSERPLTGNLATIDDYYFLQQRPTLTISNPALKPDKRISYELGFKQAISRSSALSLRAFYTELRDMVQIIQMNYAYPVNGYTTFGNIDFGTVKGVSFAYDLKSKAPEGDGTNSSGVNLTANYTLQFATGTGSNAATNAGLIAAGYPNLRNPLPLDYDVRNNVNLILDYRFGFGKGYSAPEGKFFHAIFENAGFNLQLNTHSGTPYTRQSNVTEQAAFGIAQRSAMVGSINGSRLPWSFLANFKYDKDIYIMGKRKDGNAGRGYAINVYVWVQNLLNSKNVVAVYRYTGLASDDGFINSPEGKQVIVEQVSQQAFMNQYLVKENNPTNYVSPRLIRIGASLSF